MKRPGGFGGYFIEAASEQTSPTVEDFEARLPLDVALRETAMPLPPVPTYESRRSWRRSYALAFGISLVGGTVLLEFLVRCVAR